MKPFIAIFLLPFFFLAGCLEQEAGAPAEGGFPPPPVDTVTITAVPYTLTADLPGRITPVRSARVCARVAGIVLERAFEEGSYVEKGALLFRIDPASFRVSLDGARADLARALAEEDDARNVFNRHGRLVKSGAVSTQQYDTANTGLKKASAAVLAARARVDAARLDLGYTRVTAPISGRIGRAQVSEGALVGQGQATVLAKIQQMDPIYADFNQPVSDFLRLREAFVRKKKEAADLRVSLTLEEISLTLDGQLLFADVSVDQGTGQVSLRAEFPNPRGLLLPGMFVRIKTPLTQTPNAVFVPQRAVLREDNGQARVMVVNEGGRVESRLVTTGPMVKGRWQVTSGLAPGERIVSTGADKVRPGMVLPPDSVAHAAGGRE